MTSDPVEALFTAAPPVVYNPFGEVEAVSIDLYHQMIDTCQLVDEIYEATGERVMVILQPVDECNDKLYITPPLEEEVLKQIVQDHDPRFDQE